METHIRLNDFCDICGDEMLAGVKFVTLIGNSDSTAFDHGVLMESYPQPHPESMARKRAIRLNHTSAFGQRPGVRIPPPRKSKKKLPAGLSLTVCRYPLCDRCKSSSTKAATLHTNCLKLAIRQGKGRDAACGQLGYQELLDRIWVMSVWREPFPDVSRPLCLPRSSASRGRALTSLPTFRLAMKEVFFPQGKQMPPEIWDMIFEWCRDAPWWNYIVATDFCHQVSSMPTSEEKTNCMTIPFDRILSWERNSDLVLADGSTKGKDKAGDRPAIVRLAVDAYGLKQIERLAERPAYEPKGTQIGPIVFVIEEEDKFSDAVIQAKYGLFRVKLQTQVSRGISFWDTPTPPSLENCPESRRDVVEYKRFKTIDTHSPTGRALVTGITFYVSRCLIWGVQAHTISGPPSSATRGFNELSPAFRQGIQWVYVPITPDEPLTGFGYDQNGRSFPGPFGHQGVQVQGRESRGDGDDLDIFASETFFVLRKRSRCVTIGRRPQNPYNVLPVWPLFSINTGPADEPVQTLIFEARYGRPITSMTGCFAPGVQPSEVEASCERSQFHETLVPNWYHSFAPLEKVNSTTVFRHPGTWFTQGILLTYEDGSQIALGQCRRPDSEEEVVEKPRSLWYHNVLHQPAPGARHKRSTMVKFHSVAERPSVYPFDLYNGVKYKVDDEDHEHDGDTDWNERYWRHCRPMEGLMGFFYCDDDKALIRLQEHRQLYATH